MIGQTLSHFKITAKLGEGGMGEVYRADDLSLQRAVALKLLSSESLTREDMRARFLREARTAAALNHASICTIYEVGEVDGMPFIAMELIEGSTLAARIAEAGQLPTPEMVRIAIQVADGLAAAHSHGIVHRDLKPGNIMLTPEGEAKILDFGLAKPHETRDASDPEDGASLAQTLTAEMTREGTILGTVAYMSPEQAEGRAVDTRSDVFSFGIMLYQMATGKLPFRGESTAATLAKILETEASPLSQVRQGLPPDLERIVRRCLQKRPADRYNDTRDLVAALRDLRPTGSVERSIPSGAAVARTSKSRRWLWFTAAVLAVALGGVLGLRQFFTREPDALARTAPASRDPSVAVLPFHNMSAEANDEYFSAGMTEEIISKLSRIEGLDVASRGSVASYTDPARDFRGIAEELDVNYLLDGSVRRAGERVRISAQLVDAATGRNIWSEDYEGSLEDVFAIQEETALKIAERLNVELSPAEQRDIQERPTDNIVAYDAYLRAMALSRDWGNRATLEQAIEEFGVALEHDPDFAAAMAGLAFVESDMYRNFDSSEARIRRAEEFATRAAELDPTMANASHALAMIAGARFDYHRASELFREAVRLEPKEPRFWDYLSWSLAYQIPPSAKASEEAAREALRLQPIFPGAYYHLGRALILQGRHEEARKAFEAALEQDSDFDTGHLGMAQYHLAVGNYDMAIAALDPISEKDTAIINYYVAAIHAAAGDVSLALDKLERSFELGFRDFVVLEASSYFDLLRDDARYRALVGRYQNRNAP